MRAAEPGSDHQLAWTRTFAAAARTPEHVAVLRGLLDGTDPVPGLAVDADLRWTLLQALVAVGAAGDAEIDAELERDPTASGQRRAATAPGAAADRRGQGGGVAAGHRGRRAAQRDQRGDHRRLPPPAPSAS